MNSDTNNVILLGSSVGLGLALLWLGYRHFYRRKNPYVAGVVSSLHFFPVKSCAGIDLNETEVGKRGMHFDRHWVIVDAKELLVTQRKVPRMALIRPSFEGTSYLCLDAPDMPQVKITVEMDEDEQKNALLINIFGTTCEGYYCGDEISEWLSTFLEKPGMKLYSGHNMQVLKKQILREDPTWGDTSKEGDEMMFQDSGPIMLLSQASLTAVNSHLEKKLPMKTFRPNIVVKGCGSYDEDLWNIILVGDVVMRKLRLCTRCSLTTVDQDAGTKSADKEPLVTLKRIRLPLPEDQNKKCAIPDPVFGSLFVADQIGKINIGDEVIVLK